jgi:hypothetical protein
VQLQAALHDTLEQAHRASDGAEDAEVVLARWWRLLIRCMKDLQMTGLFQRILVVVADRAGMWWWGVNSWIRESTKKDARGVIVHTESENAQTYALATCSSREKQGRETT